MLADELDFVVGVDPHRDVHAIGVVEVRSGVVVFESSVTADSGGYAEALRVAERHAPGRRAFAVEGTGSYGAGLARFLADHGEQVFEVGRLRRERRSGGKTDALDAVRAARSVLEQKRPATPRSSGEREALRALMAAREGAVNAKRAGLCQLRDLLVTDTRAAAQRAAPAQPSTAAQPALGDPPAPPPRPRAPGNAARPPRGRSTRPAADRRGTRARARDRAAHQQARPAAARPSPASAHCSPPRSCSPGHTAAACASEAAFARLAGAAPIPASSGQTIRHRLDRSGDRQLNRALHQIIVTRRRTHRPTIDYIERRVQEGKSRREATRCLKRYLARNLYRLLETPATDDLTNIEASP